METKEKMKMQAERTVEYLLKKIDKIIDNVEDGGRTLTSDEVHCLAKAWQTISWAKTTAMI